MRQPRFRKTSITRFLSHVDPRLKILPMYVYMGMSLCMGHEAGEGAVSKEKEVVSGRKGPKEGNRR